MLYIFFLCRCRNFRLYWNRWCWDDWRKMWRRSWHQKKKPSLKWNLLTFKRNTIGLFWRRTFHFYPKEQDRLMYLTWSIPWWSSGSAVTIHILSKVAKKDDTQVLVSSKKCSWIKTQRAAAALAVSRKDMDPAPSLWSPVGLRVVQSQGHYFRSWSQVTT